MNLRLLLLELAAQLLLFRLEFYLLALPLLLLLLLPQDLVLLPLLFVP